MTLLLDVNVLLAMKYTAHVHWAKPSRDNAEVAGHQSQWTATDGSITNIRARESGTLDNLRALRNTG